jgi:hypothetical protein
MGKVFGGYTDISWQSSGGYKTGNGNSFIFSLRDDSNFVKLKCLKKEYEFYYNSLFSFGGEGGFLLADNCNININSWS